jgi:hypothetical protein
MLLLGITIAVSIAIWLISQWWLVLLLVILVAFAIYAAFLWLRARRGRW